MSGYGGERGHEHHQHKHHESEEREEERREERQNEGHADPHGISKSSLRKEDVENLKHRSDISDEEKARRRRVLEEEIAAGVIGAGILGFAGYEGYVHYNKGHQAGAQH